MKHAAHALVLSAWMALALNASAGTITFDDLPVGTVVGSQYAGVVFSPNAITGDGFATNTDLTVVSATGSDVGFDGLGEPSLASGNVLRSFNAWVNENGNPSFRVSFASAINSFSAIFAGVFDSSNVTLMAYDGTSLLSTVMGNSPDEQFALSITGPHITSVVVSPGTLDDYVAVDNIQYIAAVPEPSVLALSSAGLALVVWAGKRRRKSGKHWGK